jgi:hypothetical protein
LVEPKPPLLGLPTTLQKVALISSLQITSVVGPCDEDGDDCLSVWMDWSRCVTPCATAGEVNATKATVNGTNLIASQRLFSGKVRQAGPRIAAPTLCLRSPPLSATDLGALGLLGWRKKRKQREVPLLAAAA